MSTVEASRQQCFAFFFFNRAIVKSASTHGSPTEGSVGPLVVPQLALCVKTVM